MSAQGLTGAQIAAARKIQPSTVDSYVANAMASGLAYTWPQPRVPTSAVEPVAALARQLLRELCPVYRKIRTFPTGARSVSVESRTIWRPEQLCQDNLKV